MEDRARDAWSRLDRIRGIGPKIASFFLRDLAIKYNVQVSKDRHLLQPVDVWIRRLVWLLNDRKMEDEQVARWIAGKCPEPELANQGFWYFGAQIAGSDWRLQRCLADLAYARSLCEQHVATLSATATAWNRPGAPRVDS